jgi:hypothetical protein
MKFTPPPWTALQPSTLPSAPQKQILNKNGPLWLSQSKRLVGLHMPPHRYTVRLHARVLRLWWSTLLQWEQARLYGRILRTGTNQHNLQMPQPQRPPLWPTINLLSSLTPLMWPLLGNNPIMGGLTQVSPTPLYGSLQLTRTDLHSPWAPALNRGGAPLDRPYPPYFAYGSRARYNEDNARYGGARADHT